VEVQQVHKADQTITDYPGRPDSATGSPH